MTESPPPADPAAAEVAERLARRYPGHPDRSRLRWVALAALVAAVLGFFAWTMASRNPVTAQVVSSEATSATSMTVRLVITKPADSAATCTVVAQSAGGTAVGSTDVQAPAGRAQVPLTVTVRTIDRATAAGATGCRLT